MSRYIGEYQCKLDGKGRVVVPASLKKQIPESDRDALVINRGFDDCLTIYTRKDWDLELAKLDGLNTFNKRDRLFKRLFSNGASEISIDKASRILIPKKLQEHAEIKSDVVFYAYDNKIEVWSSEKYEEMMTIDSRDLADLAEEVMTNKNADDN